jgi:uncharacterized RDD family membrane protein YckC
MAASTQEAPDPPGTAQVQAYATLDRRLAAYVLDLPVAMFGVMIPLMIVMRLIMASGAWAPAGGDIRHAWSVIGLRGQLSIFIGFLLSTGPLYVILFHASPWQATIGKRLMNIYVNGSEGQRIGIGRSISRSAAWSFLGLFGLNLVSAVMVAVTQNRKGLHDLIAGTQVLTGRTEGVFAPWRIVVSFGFPVAWLVCAFLVTL